MGPPVRKRIWRLSRGESSEGRIPRAPPVRNNAGTGAKGESRQEGNQTLKAERSGQARPRQVDLRPLMCCRDTKLRRGAGWLRLAGEVRLGKTL